MVQQLAAEKQAMLAEIERLRCQLTRVSTSACTGGAPVPAAAGAALPGPAGQPPAGGLPPAIAAAQRLVAKLVSRGQPCAWGCMANVCAGLRTPGLLLPEV